MTATQVDLLKAAFTALDEKTKETVTQGYSVTFDDQSIYDSRTSFLFLDSDTQLATCIRTNDDHYTDVQAPFEVSTASYDKILHMEGFLDMSHLMSVIDAITEGKLSDKQKSYIKKWAESINNTNLAPMEDRPYFKTDPVIPGKVHLPSVRPDLKEGDVVYDQGGFDNI